MYAERCRGCSDVLTAETVYEMDMTICEHCHKSECASCGEIEIDLDFNATGDRACLHCRSGHQRVKWFVDVYGRKASSPVQGPCNCEVAA